MPLLPTGLLVDDDVLYLRTLQRSLQKRGFAASIATSLLEALQLAADAPLEFALIDLRVGAESGLDLIGPLRSAHPEARIVLLTGYASVATAVEAIKRGADNYLLKPITVAAILRSLARPAQPQPLAPAPAPARTAWAQGRSPVQAGSAAQAQARSPESLEPPEPPQPHATMTPLSRLEWEHIHQALSETSGNVSAAARLLGMHRRSLQRKLAKRPGPERNEI